MDRKKVSKHIQDEEKLLEEMERRKDLSMKIRVKRHIKHFTFKDFAQITIGAGLFGLPAMLTVDLWDFVAKAPLSSLFFMHIFFLLCTIVAINYEYKDEISFEDKVFVMNLGKRVFFTWVTVMMCSVFMIALLEQMKFSFTVETVMKNFIAVQSIGLIGGVTFSFFKKED